MPAPPATPRDPNAFVGLDGIVRPVAEEKRLNDCAWACFREHFGRDFLAYLRGITIQNVLGPAASDAELRHLEGQRYIVAIIEARMNHGRTGQPSLPGVVRPGEPGDQPASAPAPAPAARRRRE